MTSFFKSLFSVSLLSLAMAQSALANVGPIDIPEPGSLSLVALAVGAAALLYRRKK